MNPLAAIPGSPADVALGTPAVAGGAEGNTANGFADALQRASAGQRPDATRPLSGQSRRDRTASAETSPAEPSADELAPSDGGTDEAVPAASKDKAGPDHEVEPDDGSTATAVSVVAPQADFQRGGGATAPDAEAEGQAAAGTRESPPGDADMATGPAPAAAARTAVAAESRDQASPASGNANRPAATAGDSLADAGRVDRTVPAGSAAATPATATAAGLAAQAAVLPAPTMDPEFRGPAGGAARRAGVAATSNGRVSPSAGLPDSATVRNPATAMRPLGGVRAAPELAAGSAPDAATTGDPRDAIAIAQAGPGHGFEDALVASSGSGTDSGVAIANAPGSPALTGGIRPIALPIAAPVFSPAFNQALGQQLAMALRMDLGQAELILSPADLGPVRVELSLDGNAASIQFAAPNAETRQALEQSLPDLRELFAEQGLSLANTHVGPGFHRGDDERPADEPGRQRSDRRSVAALDGSVRPMGVRVRPDALVDLFA